MVEQPVAERGAPRSQPSRTRTPAATLPSDAQRALARQRLADNPMAEAFLARDRREPEPEPEGEPAGQPVAPRSPQAVLQRVFKYEDHLRSLDLGPYQPTLRTALETAGAADTALKSFDKVAGFKAVRKFDVWADGAGVAWKPILKTVLGIDVDLEQRREREMFGTQNAKKQFLGGRVEGSSQTGFIPKHPTSGAMKLTTVPRSGPGAFDYTADEDRRILQLLRQLSTQLYGHLTDLNKLAEEEQEIQTMLAFGSLLVASNKPETAANLAHNLRKIKAEARPEQLFEILTKRHYSKQKLTTLSTRHGAKIETFYDDVRTDRVDSPNIQQIINTLVKAKVRRITDLNDHKALEEMVEKPGRIYILTAPSLKGVSHAEQRLIELRDLANVYLADPVAWVAGKKRPCFGCWIHETLANARGGYRLVYQDQPGKGFMNTYRAAPQAERDHWHTTLADEDFAFHETADHGGEAGPESDSEAEDPLPEFDDANKLVATIELLKPPQRTALKRHWEAAGGDFDEAEDYAKARKRAKVEAKEQQMEVDINNLATWAATNPNPVFRRRYSLKKRFVAKKKKTTTTTTT